MSEIKCWTHEIREADCPKCMSETQPPEASALAAQNRLNIHARLIDYPGGEIGFARDIDALRASQTQSAGYAGERPTRCPTCYCRTFADVSDGGWRCVECKTYIEALSTPADLCPRTVEAAARAIEARGERFVPMDTRSNAYYAAEREREECAATVRSLSTPKSDATDGDSDV